MKDREAASSKENQAQEAAPAGVARTAGRGGVAIAAAKVSFILFGFVQQLILLKLLDVDGYGEVSRVFATVGIVNNVVVAIGIQGVSRAVSSVSEDKAAEAFGKTLKLHVLLAIVVSAGFALLAGRIASAIEAPHISTPLRLVGAVVLLYGIYAPLVGSLNGRRRFLAQASLDIGYGAMRTASIAAGALLLPRLGQSGVLGAITGFVVAAAIIVPIAMTQSGIGKRGSGGPTFREHTEFVLPLALSQIFLNLLLQTDFLLLSHFVGDGAQAQGLDADVADRWMGVYRGVQLFAFLPYQMLMSVTFVLFPLLARAWAEDDRANVREYTMTGVRLAFLLTGLMCSAIAGLAPHVLRLLPNEIWPDGGAPLRILSLGMGSFAILGVISAALTSMGSERKAALLTVITVGLVAVGCIWLIPQAPFGATMLIHAAIAASVALTIAVFVGAFVLRRVAGAFVAIATPLRVFIALGAAIFVGSHMPWMGKLIVPVQALVVGLVYMLALVLLREVDKTDLVMIKRAFGRGRSA